LLRLRAVYPFELKLLHINFGLRGDESRKDEKLVQLFSRNHKLECLIHRVSGEWSEGGIQDQARQIRLKLCENVLVGYDWIEAHHADDQLETFLFRLFRGAGPAGLIGLRKDFVRNSRRIRRPLLSVTKRELLEYCLKNQVPYRLDQSNLQNKYSRNQIRNLILPLIFKLFPAAESNIKKSQALIKEDAEYLDQLARESFASIYSSGSMMRKKMTELAPPLRKRVFRLFLEAELGRFPPGERLTEFDDRLGRGDNFIWNAPQNCWVEVQQSKIQMIKPKERENSAEWGGVPIT